MKQKKYYILSFIIPTILMILLYLSVGVIGGNKNVLTVDLANQYVEFFAYFKIFFVNIRHKFWDYYTSYFSFRYIV